MKTSAKIFALLCVVQLLGIGGSVVASTVEIESIVFTGPCLSVLGIVVACGWSASRNVSTLIFGLSTGFVSVFVFILIVSQSWSPSEARVPVPLVLLGYELIFIPIGLFSFYKTIVISHEKKDGRRWQFNLRSIFAITLIVAVSCATAKLANEFGTAVLLAVAIGLCSATIIAVCVVGYFASRHNSGYKSP